MGWGKNQAGIGRQAARVSLLLSLLAACKPSEPESCDVDSSGGACSEECTKLCFPSSGNPTYFGHLNDEVLLVAEAGCGKEGQWSLLAGSDPKTAHTIATFPDNPTGPGFLSATTYNGQFYLSDSERVLVYDGMGDARQVEFADGPLNSGTFAASNHALYFRDSLHLYRIEDDRAERLFTSFIATDWTPFGDQVCFLHSSSLWCDGSGTPEEVADFYFVDFRTLPWQDTRLIYHQQSLYFRVVDEDDSAALYRYGGGDPERVIDLSATADTPELFPLAGLSDSLLLIADDDSSLWTYDGQELSPYPVGASFRDPLAFWPDPKQPGAILLLASPTDRDLVVGKALYFIDGANPPLEVPSGSVEDVYSRGGELHFETHSPAGIFEWKGGGEVELLIGNGGGASFSDPFLHEGDVYVQGLTSEDGNELFRVTEEGGELVRDFYPGTRCYCECPEPD